MEVVGLPDGNKMPVLGLGTYKMASKMAERSVRSAIDLGYRSIDTASAYGDEESVGDGIRSSDIDREDIFITSKVGTSEQGYENTKEDQSF